MIKGSTLYRAYWERLKSIVQKIIKKRYKIFLTLSDEKKYALAMVVITY